MCESLFETMRQIIHDWQRVGYIDSPVLSEIGLHKREFLVLYSNTVSSVVDLYAPLARVVRRGLGALCRIENFIEYNIFSTLLMVSNLDQYQSECVGPILKYRIDHYITPLAYKMSYVEIDDRLYWQRVEYILYLTVTTLTTNKLFKPWRRKLFFNLKSS